MPLPELTAGLVVRYEYLWHRRSVRAEIADKDHPACVVATFRQKDKPEDFVIYLPISHSPPSVEEDGIELPDRVKTAAGLDRSRQWVLISECNIDKWPIDLRQLPDQAGRFHYGYLPPGFFKAVRDAFIASYRSRRLRQVSRFGP